MKTVTFIESFLSAAEADVLLASLAKLPWARGRLMGNPVPRDEVWMGPYPYKFGGRILNPVPWTPEIEVLRNRIQVAGYGSEYNSVLLNRYVDEKDGLPKWHADDEPEMDPQHPIASVSLGACREFQIRPNGQKIQKFFLPSGSLLIMPAGFQQGHEHRVPKTEKQVGERVNLTFRRLLLRGK